MVKTIPMIITNKNILIKERDSDAFLTFEMPNLEEVPNIPFYHHFAGKIAESQHYFKEFIGEHYGKKYTKNVFAIIIPDDTSALEKIFINEFFVNSGACRAVAQMTMAKVLSKEQPRYVSLSKSQRNIILEYIAEGDIRATRYYDYNDYDINAILADARRLHIDIEYEEVPVFINNFNLNMDDFLEYGQVVTPKVFLEKVAQIDVEKI